MLKQLAVEFIGTFIFISVILATGEAIPIGIALAAAVFFASKVNYTGQFNPAVTAAVWLQGKIPSNLASLHVLVQVCAGASAYFFREWVVSK